MEGLKLVSETKGKFIDIEDCYEENKDLIDKYGNSYIKGIVKDKYIYKKKDGRLVIKEIIMLKINKPLEVIERKKNWKPFGFEHNKNVTNIGEEVDFEIVDKNYNFNPIIKKKKIAFKSSNKKYVPKFKKYEIKNKKLNNNNTFSNNSYIPPNIKRKMEENKNIQNFSIVIKNIPTNFDIYTAKEYITKLFKKYGQIKKINILTDKYNHNKIRDIAFIDFVYPNDAINLLKSNERFIIDSCILTLEKSKKK